MPSPPAASLRPRHGRLARLAGLVLGALTLLVLANVLGRRIGHLRLGFLEEIAGPLMVALTFLGSAAAVVSRRHLRVDLLLGMLDGPRRRWAESALLVASAAIAAVLIVLFGMAAWDDWRFGMRSNALRIPVFWYTAMLPILAAILGAAAIVALRRLRRRPVDDNAPP